MQSFTNKSYDDRSPLFVYQGDWPLGTGTWNASNTGMSGTITLTNDLNASVSFEWLADLVFETFPEPATAFYYYGLPRSRGAFYGICIDCDPNNPDFIPFDAFNASDDGKNPPIMLYSRTFSEPGFHEIIIRNQADNIHGVPPGNSELTVDRIDLTVLSDLTAIPTISVTKNNVSVSNTVASTSTWILYQPSKPPSSLSPLPSLTSLSLPLSPRPSNQTALYGVIGALGALVVGATFIAFIFWHRSRWNRSPSYSFKLRYPIYLRQRSVKDFAHSGGKLERYLESQGVVSQGVVWNPCTAAVGGRT